MFNLTLIGKAGNILKITQNVANGKSQHEALERKWDRKCDFRFQPSEHTRGNVISRRNLHTLNVHKSLFTNRIYHTCA